MSCHRACPPAREWSCRRQFRLAGRSFDIRAVAVGVFALGLLASAAAVVPGFSGLIRGSRTYLVSASGLGLVAFASAVLTLVNRTEATLAALVILMVALWVGATTRHAGSVGVLAPRARN